MKLRVSSAVFLIGFLFSTASNSSSINVGLGAEVSNDFKIYMPIDVGLMTIEPTLAAYSRESKYENINGRTDTDIQSTEIGVGIFRRLEISEKIIIYFGSRVGYLLEENSSSSLNTSNKNKIEGYTISPTFGYEYQLLNGLSIGVDTSVIYSKSEGKDSFVSSYSPNQVSIEKTFIRTSADIVLRYRFK